jgi:hypothetical protein
VERRTQPDLLSKEMNHMGAENEENEQMFKKDTKQQKSV